MKAAQTRALVRFFSVAVPTLALATVAVAILQDDLGVPNPSAVYLVAVVATAIVSGTAGAIGTAVASFVLYNYLFTEPRFTLSMHEPGVWLSVVLLLFVGVVVGQLAALQRDRAELATRREREARALFSVSRALATRESIDLVLTEIARALEADAHMEQVVVTVGAGDNAAVGFDSRGVINQLRRMPGDTPAEWVRVHQPATRQRSRADENGAQTDVYRVLIESGGGVVGSIWALRARGADAPRADETRLLGAAADQLGQAIAHDRLAADAQNAEIARESDALKSALLQSVSHDLRTPLATIRAAAGTLLGDTNDGNQADAARRESIGAIDREVEYLNRLVSNLLDLSRIEAGVLRAALDTFELDDLVHSTLERLGPRLDGWTIEDQAGQEVVDADPVFFDATLTNVVENALRHTPAGTTIRFSARTREGRDGVSPDVVLTVEDSGPGVPDHAYGRLFEKFYRAPGRRSSRSGTGIGLAVAHGLIEAMGGRISARRSALGGLAIDITLRGARVPAELAATSPQPQGQRLAAS
jgi:two-component system sensor histidine kinase KdpD